MHCIRKLAEEALKSELLSSTPTYKVRSTTHWCQLNDNTVDLAANQSRLYSGETAGILPRMESSRLLKEHLCETQWIHFA